MIEDNKDTKRDEALATAVSFIDDYNPLPWERWWTRHFVKDAYQVAPEHAEGIGSCTKSLSWASLSERYF